MKSQRNISSWIRVFLACCCLFGLMDSLAATDEPSMQVLMTEDVSAKASLDEVLAGQLVFHPINIQSQTNLGSTDSAFWLRIRLENLTNRPLIRWLVIGPPRLRHISLFEFTDSRWQETRGGFAEPFSSRAIPTLSQAFERDLPAHSVQELLVRVSSETMLMIQPRLYKPEQLMYQEWQAVRTIYFISGVLVLALLFGILLALFTHERVFLVYGLAALFYILIFWGISGLAFRELWPDSPGWALHSIGFFIALSLVMLLWTHRLLLNAPRYLDRILQLLISVFLLLAILMLLSSSYYRILTLLLMTLSFVVTLGSPVLGFFAWRRGVLFYGYGFATYTLPWQLSQLYYIVGVNWLNPIPLPFFLYGIRLEHYILYLQSLSKKEPLIL